ncbi:RebB family R body protein [Sulfidibacter corallicola]|uniref:RebB family R body protein n=1 Tax=Sulfidibacter corallicola TaxID=2818388 RepID=A0A8A4TKT0_SULCO|nr:RebB family R body protein [Sulfidibacter corallicola]QTD49448.1 RebB family R body protein [Sulfidibacter corallicola]
MAFPTAVNSQITDSVTQVNTKVVGDSPAVSTSNLYLATSQALGNAAHNATSNQQHAFMTMQAATTQGVTSLLALGTAATGTASKEIIELK